MVLFNIVCIKPSNGSQLKHCHLAIKSELSYGSQFPVMIVRSVGTVRSEPAEFSAANSDVKVRKKKLVDYMKITLILYN